MSGSRGGAGGKTPPDLQAALERLERAVRRFAASARGEFADRATAFIEEAALKLELESRGENTSDSRRSESPRSGSPEPERGTRRKRRRHRRRGRSGYAAAERDDRRLGRKLYRDPEKARIVGVCAGVASYLGAEVWVARCVAVTGLIFMPSIVFPAYWILYFVLNPPPEREPDGQQPGSSGPEDHSSPAPELGPKLSPRRSLRNLRADLAQAELRLRRMETHVTSGQYELQKELNKLDGAGARG